MKGLAGEGILAVGDVQVIVGERLTERGDIVAFHPGQRPGGIRIGDGFDIEDEEFVMHSFFRHKTFILPSL